MALLQEVLGTDLSPKKLTGIAIKKTQGTMMATQFLPERSWPEFSGYYKTWNDVAFGQLAPQVGEGAPDTLLNTTYVESSFTMAEYRIGGEITERAIKFLLSKNSKTHVSAGRELVRDEVEFLSDTITLREEKKIIDLIKASVQTGFTVEANGPWSESGSTPVTNLRDAVRIIKTNWHTEPDTMLINPQVEMDILTHSDVTGIYTNSGNNALIQDSGLHRGQSRAVPRLVGLDVFVSHAVESDGNIAIGGTENLLVGNNYALVFKRGNSTGVTYVAEPMTVRSWDQPGTRSAHVQVFKTFVPVVYRPKQIAIINNI